MGYRLKPDDFASRKAHYQVNMCLTFGDFIDIMTEAVTLGEKNLDEVFLLFCGSVNV